MTDQPHWGWLHGPAKKPDPRVGERSLSAARRDQPADLPRVPWDDWLHEQIRNLTTTGRQPEEAA